MRARALVGLVRVGLGGWLALHLLWVLVNAPVLILHDSGLTPGALLMIAITLVIFTPMLAMALYVGAGSGDVG